MIDRFYLLLSLWTSNVQNAASFQADRATKNWQQCLSPSMPHPVESGEQKENIYKIYMCAYTHTHIYV